MSSRPWQRTVAALAMLGVTTACATSRIGTDDDPAITATDVAGKEVRLAAPAERVVAIPIPAASMLVAVAGGPAVLAGMNPSAKQAIEDGYLGKVYPELKDVPSDVTTEGFAPVMENLLAVDPDLVIQWGDEGAGLVTPLIDAGLPVAQLMYGTQEYLEGAVELYGELLGEQDRADELLKRMHTALDTYADKAKTPGSKKPRVLHFSGVKEGLKVAGASSYNSYMIELVGGRNPAAGLQESAASVNLEQVLAWDPEVILLGNFDASNPADIYADKRWSSISAVKNKQVYKVPLGGYRWDPPSQESPLMWEWMDSLINEKTLPASLPDSIRDLYEFLYGQPPTRSDLRTILQTSANAESLGYADAS